jgi:methylase of polypeptide subunit release factors
MPRTLKGKTALDFGCGNGVLAIVASILGADRVYAVDIEREFLDLTIANTKALGAHNVVVVRRSELDSIANATVDYIVSNPSSLPVIAEAPKFLSGGPDGLEMIRDLLTVSEKLCRVGGTVTFTQTSLAPLSLSIELLRQHGFVPCVKKSLPFAFRRHYFDHLSYFREIMQKGKGCFFVQDGVYYEHGYVVTGEKVDAL